MTYFGLMRVGEKKAEEKQLEKTAVKSLLLFASSKSPTEIYEDLHEEVPKVIETKFFELLNEYLEEGKPVQYIIGYTYFYGYKILVNEDVLIPRWETEELTEHILIYYDRIFKGSKVKTLDLGTGSGAIAIALKKEAPEMEVMASDISEAALKVAEENASINKADIIFEKGDLFKAVPKGSKFDIIVSNPPYLMTSEYVMPIVKDNEPHVALFGGEDGLDFYRSILLDARRYLNEDRYMMAFEHGYDKVEDLNKIIKNYFPEAEIVNLKDSAGRNRMTFIIKK